MMILWFYGMQIDKTAVKQRFKGFAYHIDNWIFLVILSTNLWI